MRSLPQLSSKLFGGIVGALYSEEGGLLNGSVCSFVHLATSRQAEPQPINKLVMTRQK